VHTTTTTPDETEFVDEYCANSTNLDGKLKMVKNMVMEAPIADVKKRLCELVGLVENGETIVILRHGRPVARLVPMPISAKPWRVETPDNPKHYKGINIDEPSLEEI
jgi:prevent-host-death family protein